MLTRLKRAAAPAILRHASKILRGAGMGADAKDRLWRLTQRHAAYFDVALEATIGNGMKMRVTSKPRVEQEILLFGKWEPSLTRYIQNMPPDKGIFLDIGANIGYFSMLASKLFDEVHAIEASPSTARRLRENIAANDIENIHVHEGAVGAAEGHVDFYQHKVQSGGASTIKTLESVFEARVPIAPLEKILDGINWARVRFIKIDVEGLEAPVMDSLFALRDGLQSSVEIFVEYDPERHDAWPSIQAFMTNGFSVAMMQGPYDRRDYVELDRRTELKPIDGPPDVFCDLLLSRAPAGDASDEAMMKSVR